MIVRLAGTPGTGPDDGAGDSLRAGAAALRGRAAGYRNPAVAVVIFSHGLIGSTLLDTFLTPAMFWLFGRKGRRASGGRPRCPRALIFIHLLSERKNHKPDSFCCRTLDWFCR